MQRLVFKGNFPNADRLFPPNHIILVIDKLRRIYLVESATLEAERQRALKAGNWSERTPDEIVLAI